MNPHRKSLEMALSVRHDSLACSMGELNSSLELVIAQGLDRRFEGVYPGDAWTQPLEFAVVLRADNLCEELTKH